MEFDREKFNKLSYEEREKIRKGSEAIMQIMAKTGDKDAIVSAESIKACEKIRDINLKILRKDDKTKDAMINLMKQIGKILDDFEKEMRE